MPSTQNQEPGLLTSQPSSFPASQRSSYFVELPYTLPQDSTLFIIHREKTIDIWKRKLAWIAEKGGMALLKTHPDYMDFDGDGRDGLSYPVQHYIDFLHYVRNRYGNLYFHVLPSALGQLWSSLALHGFSGSRFQELAPRTQYQEPRT